MSETMSVGIILSVWIMREEVDYATVVDWEVSLGVLMLFSPHCKLVTIGIHCRWTMNSSWAQLLFSVKKHATNFLQLAFKSTGGRASYSKQRLGWGITLKPSKTDKRSQWNQWVSNSEPKSLVWSMGFNHDFKKGNAAVGLGINTDANT